MSLTIVSSNPCNLNTLSMKACATCNTLYGWCNAIKQAYLVSLSTTTRIIDLPKETGKPSMKSKEMSVQAAYGMGKGWRSPGYAKLSLLHL